MTFNTGNTVPSTDARDLYDNAQNFDQFSVGQELEYPDRLGVPRRSIAGIRHQVNEALADLGYIVKGDYAAGLVIGTYGELFSKDGEFYRAKAGLALPYSLNGSWAVDAPKFVSVGDAVLRQELAGEQGAEMVGRTGGGALADLLVSAPGKGVDLIPGAGRVLDSIASLRLVNGSKHVFLTGYYAQGDGGGGHYYLDAADTASADNGGSIIVSDAGERWKLASLGVFTVRQFGAKGDGNTNDTDAFQRAIAATSVLQIPNGVFVCGTLTIAKEMRIFGAGATSDGSVIKSLSLSGDVFQLTSSSTTIENLYFTAASPRSSGAYVNCQGFGGHYLSRLEMWNAYDAIVIASSSNVTVNACRAFTTTGVCVSVVGGFNHSIYDFHANNPSGSQPIAGIRVTAVGDLSMVACKMLQCGTALLVDVADGAFINSLEITDCFFDTSTLTGRIRSTGSGQIQRVDINNTWFGNSQAQGLVLSSTGTGAVNGVFLNNVRCAVNLGDGVEVGANVKNVHIASGHYGQCSGSAISVSPTGELFMQGGLVGAGAGLNGNGRGFFISSGAVGQVIGTRIIGNTTQVTNGAGAGFGFIYTPGYTP
ncbi:glycosyl hydrolase family 28-related protein [Stutzerimonas kunmingensis]|uniref:glycosyl hydrolase family 28-related protein n=1 Tax=Stutzerimonas kunmingensis TaxID=1211807 RepID=UPI0028A6396C|nr:glycosyl hydrolase family 28-related protein [Stutzerimonas kunmingensis]